MTRQDRQCFYCDVYENIRPIHEHHAQTRGSHPELIDDPLNKVLLCERCHRLAHSRHAILVEILNLWKLHLKKKHQENLQDS